MENQEESKGRVYAGLARVRLEIEGLKHTVMACLDTVSADMGASIQHYTEEAVRNFNFPEQVARVANDAINEVIRTLVKNAVQQALRENGALRRIIEVAVAQAIAKEVR